MNEKKASIKTMIESTDLQVIEPFRWAYSRDKYLWLDFGFEEIEEFIRSIKSFNRSAQVYRMPRPNDGWAPLSDYKEHVTEVYLCLMAPNILHRLVITESDCDFKE